MRFNEHDRLAGKHAFLSASKYSWLNYDEERLAEAWERSLAVQRGTETHEFAATCIRRGQKLPKSKKTLNLYVNDAIGFKMAPEQVLYYSDNCFGTADAICFRDGVLRIHDLKTGVIPAHMEQLMVYAALFCLEYRTKPGEIDTELRIYQSDEVLVHRPEPEEIEAIIDCIVQFDGLLCKLQAKEA